MTAPSIYIAGGSHDLPRAKAAFAAARALGFEVAYDWVAEVEAHGAANDVPFADAFIIANRELDAAACADVFWLLGDPNHVSRGAHIEFGSFLGNNVFENAYLSGVSARLSIFYAGARLFEHDADVLRALEERLATERERARRKSA